MTAFIVLVVVAFLAFGGFLFISQSDYQRRLDSFQGKCAAANGHIYNPGGVSFCLTADGRFVEVYPWLALRIGCSEWRVRTLFFGMSAPPDSALKDMAACLLRHRCGFAIFLVVISRSGTR